MCRSGDTDNFTYLEEKKCNVKECRKKKKKKKKHAGSSLCLFTPIKM